MGTSHEGWNDPRTRRTLLRQAGVGGATLAGSSLLAACGGGSSGGSGGSGDVTIEFWDMLWGLDTYERTARGLVAEYNRKHPGVTVKYRLIPWTSFYEVFSTAVASGTTPDVSTGASFQAFQFADAIAPVNDAVKEWRANGTANDILPAAITTQIDGDGKQTGLPYSTTLRVLSYNRMLFDRAGLAPPTTFDELRTIARKLTRGGVYGFGMCGTTALPGQQMIALFLNNGGGIYSTQCEPNIVNDRNREVCELLQAMVKDGSIPKAAVGWDNTDLANAIARDQIGMVIHEPGLFNSLPNGRNLDVASPMTGPHGDRGTILWYSAMWLYQSSKNPDKALDFMNWWLSHEQPLWTRGGATPLPVRKSFYREIPSLQDPRTRKVLDEWVPIGKILDYPCDHALPTLNQVEGQDFLAVLGQDILSLKPIDASLQKAQDALSQLKV